MGDTVLYISREVQTSCFGIALDDFIKPWFVDGDLTLLEFIYFIFVDIDTEHRIADFSQAGPGNETDISRTENGDFHENV